MRFFRKWLIQAEADLKAGRDSLEAGNYNWSCFQAQQSAEKALKAFLYFKGYTSIMTHSIKELLRECGKIEEEFGALRNEARFLDMFYIPTRYPDGLAGELAPAEFYEKEDAAKCLNSAELILKKVKKSLKI
ncbi:DNA-binding protein [Methanosarcinales archaeon]|nr:HEPN domain-containing protein [Candidatus Syntrophoarchaeum sp.]RLG31880.1 MAG: DNA-binding protein [Methanosarcinales archaeon]